MLIVPRWLGALVVLGLTFWWALGLAVAGPGGDSLRLALAAIYALAGLAAVVGLVLERGWRPALAVYGVALLAVLRRGDEREWLERGKGVVNSCLPQLGQQRFPWLTFAVPPLLLILIILSQ